MWAHLRNSPKLLCFGNSSATPTDVAALEQAAQQVADPVGVGRRDHVAGENRELRAALLDFDVVGHLGDLRLMPAYALADLLGLQR